MKTILISGTSRGLGKELARVFCKNDFNYFGLTKWDNLDITDYENIEEYINNISKEDFPEILINNAGICIQDSLLNLKMEDVKNVFEVNLFALIHLTKIYVKRSLEYNLKTKIINIASTAGTGARSGRSIYAASKASVINFSQSMSEELKDFGIKIYCICPGAFDSDLRREIEPDDNFNDMLKPYQIAEEIYNISKSKYMDNQIIYIRS